MNVKEIKELVDLVARRGLAGLEVERAGFRLRIEGAPRARPHRGLGSRGAGRAGRARGAGPRRAGRRAPPATAHVPAGRPAPASARASTS